MTAVADDPRARTAGPLDLTRCTVCGFTASGISAGCPGCARRQPDRYAAWAQEMSQELDDLHAAISRVRELCRSALASTGGPDGIEDPTPIPGWVTLVERALGTEVEQ